MTTLTQLPKWDAISQYLPKLPPLNVLMQDAARCQAFQLEAADLTFDFAQQRLDQSLLLQLINFADQQGLLSAIAALFAGEAINTTEKRPALHTALREQNSARQKPEVLTTLAKMRQFVGQVASGKWQGYAGDTITDIVNIGIGGSDLGPRMVVTALKDFQQGLRCHFVANVDADELRDVLGQVDPKTTLFIVTSKTFTTIETLTNANTARAWLQQHTDQIEKHFIAVTANVTKAVEFGIDENNIFPMWDWVGGRYSLWSAVGLPIALALGFEQFQQLLQGAYCMDQHFATAPFGKNMPVIAGLIDVLNINGYRQPTLAVLPYSHRLRLLPNFLQQLMMESNGKSMTKDNKQIHYQTGAIVWGGEETNGQHAFHQLIFQGTQSIAADFILVQQAAHSWDEHQQLLLANGRAQMQALLQGRQTEHPYQTIVGNKTCSAIYLEKLTPHTLGALIAFYEHRTFVQSVCWQINAFDQWGVELGKLLAKQQLAEQV